MNFLGSSFVAETVVLSVWLEVDRAFIKKKETKDCWSKDFSIPSSDVVIREDKEDVTLSWTQQETCSLYLALLPFLLYPDTLSCFDCKKSERKKRVFLTLPSCNFPIYVRFGFKRGLRSSSLFRATRKGFRVFIILTLIMPLKVSRLKFPDTGKV